MRITAVDIQLVGNDPKLLANVTLTMDECFVVKNITVVKDGKEGRVNLPGEERDHRYEALRQFVVKAVWDAYEKAKREAL